MTIKTTLSVNE